MASSSSTTRMTCLVIFGAGQFINKLPSLLGENRILWFVESPEVWQVPVDLWQKQPMQAAIGGV